MIGRLFLRTEEPIIPCTGCIHEWKVRGEWRCDLGNLHGIRCTSFTTVKKGKK